VVPEETSVNLFAIDSEAQAPHPIIRKKAPERFNLLPVLDQEARVLGEVDVHASLIVAIEAVNIPVVAHSFLSPFLASALALAIQA
jgi:hypothetical protein